jgi:hypothetical protein
MFLTMIRYCKHDYYFGTSAPGITLVACIREVRGSRLARDTDYFDTFLVPFLSLSRRKGGSTTNLARTISFQTLCNKTLINHPVIRRYGVCFEHI